MRCEDVGGVLRVGGARGRVGGWKGCGKGLNERRCVCVCVCAQQMSD